jgi:hypothetical protein
MSQPKDYQDYPADQIAAKLEQVEIFETKYGANNTTKSWRKWCTDQSYRNKEWRFRQATANSVKPNINYTK